MLGYTTFVRSPTFRGKPSSSLRRDSNFINTLTIGSEPNSHDYYAFIISTSLASFTFGSSINRQ